MLDDDVVRVRLSIRHDRPLAIPPGRWQPPRRWAWSTDSGHVADRPSLRPGDAYRRSSGAGTRPRIIHVPARLESYPRCPVFQLN